MSDIAAIPSTKFHLPPIGPLIVSRPRLVGRIEEALGPDRGIVLLSAPPGFGKTTLLAEWANGGKSRGRARRVAWLSLDEDDGDIPRFFRCLVTALRRFEPGFGEPVLSLLGSPLASSAKACMALFIEEASTIAERLVLALDDFHCIRDPRLIEATAFLLSNRPSNLGIAIACRGEPVFPLSRLRVLGRLTELGPEDLRFSRDEAGLFLGRATGSPLANEELDRLEEKTEGWAAALKLASLSLAGGKDSAAFVRDFGGTERRVFDYLAEEVVAGLPSGTRIFLETVSVLESFCAPLCDALRDVDGCAPGRASRDAGEGASSTQVLIEGLERSGLFLVPLDDRREWYRLHRLFADFLRARLKPEAEAAAHRAAALWFEARGFRPDAARHILAYAKAADLWEDAARIIVAAGTRALAEGELVTLLGWLEALPERIVRGDAWLASYKAWCLVMTGKADEAEAYIAAAEERLGPDSPPVDRGRVLSLRCSVSEATFIIESGPRALELLGDCDPLSRTGMLFTLGDAQDDSGDVAGAERSFSEAYDISSRRGFLAMGAVALAHKAISINYQGRRSEALRLCRQGIEKYADSRGNPLPVAGLLFVVSGELKYEANELEDALRDLRKGIELGRRAAAMRVTLYGMEEAARALSASGDAEAALAMIREAQELASEACEEGWKSMGAATEAFIAGRQGDLSALRLWAKRSALPLDGTLDQTRKFEYSCYVRALLALGEAAAALPILEALRSEAERQHRDRHLITILVQRSLAEWMLRDEEGAKASLLRALGLAERERYIRAFLDEGPALGEALGRLGRERSAFAAAIERRRIAEDRGESGAHRGEDAPSEDLSGRELEVLRLMALKLSAPEIAKRLYVSASTVRSHLKHIYWKLGAHSRHEAIDLAKKATLI